ncbi:hypothetical protein [Tropicimonas sp. S265A]|uniref:hypothetical protein n=1 Tax=Tropicimonas sp. S265A TaxID=3415134 RepID=UPI003C7E8F86
MNAVTIDTYKTIQKLQAKGFTAEQAEGIVDALTESELVTKADLRSTVGELETRLYRAMLIQTGAIAAIVIGIMQFTLS